MYKNILPNAPMGHSWQSLMHEAILLAKKGEELGEVPVGALLVNMQGDIIAKAHNEPISSNDPTAHAEILVLRRAAILQKNYRLQNTILIVTLEPCLMCTGAIVHARLDGVVYGAYDKKSGAVSSCLHGLDLPLLNHQTWHMGGILEQECSSLLDSFFKTKRLA